MCLAGVERMKLLRGGGGWCLEEAVCVCSPIPGYEYTFLVPLKTTWLVARKQDHAETGMLGIFGRGGKNQVGV